MLKAKTRRSPAVTRPRKAIARRTTPLADLNKVLRNLRGLIAASEARELLPAGRFVAFALAEDDKAKMTAAIARCMPRKSQHRIPAFLADIEGVIAIYRAMAFGPHVATKTLPRKQKLKRIRNAAETLVDALDAIMNDPALHSELANRFHKLLADAALQTVHELSANKPKAKFRLSTDIQLPVIPLLILYVGALSKAATWDKPLRGGRPLALETFYLLLPALACMKDHFPSLFKDGSFCSPEISHFLAQLLEIAAPNYSPHVNRKQIPSAKTRKTEHAKAQLIRRARQMLRSNLRSGQKP